MIDKRSDEKYQQLQMAVNTHTDVNFQQQAFKLTLMRRISENGLVFLLQYSGLLLCTVTDKPLLVWFATGSACGFAFLRGYSILLGVWLGSLAAYLSAGAPFYLALDAAIIYSAQTAGLLYVIRRYCGATLLFSTLTALLKFLLCAILIVSAASISLFFLSLRVAAITPSFSVCLQWIFANLNGLFVFSTALLTLDAYFPQWSSFKLNNKIQLIFSYFIWGVLSAVMLISNAWAYIAFFSISSLIYLVLLHLLWGECAAIAAVFIQALIWAMAGLFVPQSPLPLQVLLLLEILSSLSLMIMATRARQQRIVNIG